MNEKQKEEQHDRRNIDSAKVGQKPPNWPQGRFSNSVQKIANHEDDPVLGVDDVKCDQPAQNSGNN